MEEIWVVIQEAPSYEISSEGRVRRQSSQRIVMPTYNRINGHFVVHLHVGRRIKMFYLMRLMRAAYNV